LLNHGRIKFQKPTRRTARMLREMEVPNRKAPQRWAKPNSIVKAHSYKRFNHDINCSAVQTATQSFVIKIRSALMLYLSACDRSRRAVCLECVHVPCMLLLARKPGRSSTTYNLTRQPSRISHITYRGIAFRSRQNGRRNQSPQRQNPGQPGRGLLLLNPLVFTR